jgi:nitrobindin-like protein
VSELRPGPLHDDVTTLGFLLGTWRGAGTGEYPTIDPFAYEEEMRFQHVGDAFLLYQEASWSPADGAPIHFERGFLRPGRDGWVELVLAHPIGLTEVSEGPLEGTEFALTSRDVSRTSTGLDATSVVRRYRVDGDAMSYETDMATERTPMALHLRAELRRVIA